MGALHTAMMLVDIFKILKRNCMLLRRIALLGYRRPVAWGRYKQCAERRLVANIAGRHCLHIHCKNNMTYVRRHSDPGDSINTCMHSLAGSLTHT